ncbi:glycoside hydrolase family 30 protein [Xylariaceae sp. FL0804]|nr:glycoside hydrolase family 30 protein [Xylariaceae sp. FL0804]
MIFAALALLAGPALCAPSSSSSSAAAAAAAANAKVRRASAQAFASSSDLTYALTEVDAPVSGAGTGGDSTWSLTVDDTDAGERQTIVGFGGAVTDATVTVLNALPSDQRSALIGLLLTTDDAAGAGFGLLRHSIAASDLSAPPAYTYDDNGGSADPDLGGFALGDRGTAMAQMLADMRGVKSDLTILGSPWSAPGWMKQNGELIDDADDNSLNSAYYDQYAQYFVDYLQAYADAGASIDAITLQNEPLNSQGDGMITMYQAADEAATLTQDYVGPALRAAGLAQEVWAYDHNTDTPSYPDTVVSAAGEYAVGTAWHCYATDLDWTVLSDFHDAHPDTAQYMTECWTSPSTSWYQASRNAIGPLQNWAAGAMMWTLGTWSENASDPGTFGPYLPGGCDTCRGLFTVDEAAGTYELQADYYMLAQVSRFLLSGATVLAGSGSYTYDGGSGVQSVAARNPDGGRAVVVENAFDNDVYLTLNTTSGEQWSGNLPANSVVTWLLP